MENFWMAAVLAATACAAARAAPGDETPLEEIVVTAGFREVPELAGPGSVTVVDAAEIRARAAEHLETVLDAVPNVTYSSAASRASFVQVRGIGDLEQFVDPKHYPSVGISIDGIDIGGTANAAMLFDTEQVEVLRGPQGTAFGASALAGLINIRGRRGTDSLESYLDLGVGNYGSWNLGGAVGGPLGAGARGRLALQVDRGDGYVENAYLHRNDTNGYDERFLRGSLDVEGRNSGTYALTALYFDDDNGYDAFSLDNTRTTLSDQPGRDRQSSRALAGRGSWEVGADSRLEAVATWSDTQRLYAFDEDWTYVGICDGTLCDPVLDFYSATDTYDRARRDHSLDVRWLGTLSGSKLGGQYVLGAYAQNRDEDLDRRHGGLFESRYGTERRALYGQLTADLSARLSLTGGLRYEQFDDHYADSADLVTSSDDELRSGELTLAYETERKLLWYLTYSRGTKPGVVNTEASSSLPLMQPAFQAFIEPRLRARKETLVNREVGLKGRFISDRLAARIALFDMARRDAQLESWIWDGLSYLWIGFLDNVDGQNRGLEAELDFALSDRIRLSGAFGRLSTRIDHITTFDLDVNDFVVRENIEQAKSPEWQYHLGAALELSPRTGLDLALDGSADSRFGYYHDGRLDAYRLLSARLRFTTQNGEWSIWGRNLTDEAYAVHGLYFGNDPRKGWINESYYQYGEPRVIGVSVRYAF